MTDMLPCMIAAALATASVTLFATVIVRRQTWRRWRSPFHPHRPQERPAATSMANAAPAPEPGEKGLA